MILRKFLHSFPILLLTLLLSLSSCEKFSGDQTIPSYLKIDSIRLKTDYATQGTAIHNITDAWVYIDGTLIGTFQMPARFPVLFQGKHTLQVLPGVKKDGVSTTRISYPFYKPVTETIDLTPDKTLDLKSSLVSNYSPSCKFLWKEDFDDVALTLDSTSAATEKIKLTPTDSPLTLEGLHSGIVELDTVGATFEAVSHSTFGIPLSQVFLELNFNVNTPIEVGVYLTLPANVIKSPVVYLNSTNDKWKKIYIDLSNTLYAYSGASSFRVYFYLKNTSGTKEKILLDNIKLLSY